MKEQFPALNLPKADLRLKRSAAKVEVFDRWRKKYLVLTPEEWVRQHFLHYLVDHLSYPAGLISVEKNLKSGQQSYRADALVHDRTGKEIVLIEFKAIHVAITEETLFQTARYNKVLSLPFLIMSNGLDHYCLKMNNEGMDFEYLDKIPTYEELFLK